MDIKLGGSRNQWLFIVALGCAIAFVQLWSQYGAPWLTHYRDLSSRATSATLSPAVEHTNSKQLDQLKQLYADLTEQLNRQRPDVPLPTLTRLSSILEQDIGKHSVSIERIAQAGPVITHEDFWRQDFRIISKGRYSALKLWLEQITSTIAYARVENLDWQVSGEQEITLLTTLAIWGTPR